MPKKHYSTATLDVYRHHGLPRKTAFRCWLHLLFCSSCKQRFRQLYDDDLLIEDLKSALRTFDIPDNPTQLQKLSRIFCLKNQELENKKWQK